MNRLIWEVIHDADMDNGLPTMWCTTVKGHYIWISLCFDNTYLIETKEENIYYQIHRSASLQEAKRWVKRTLWLNPDKFQWNRWSTEECNGDDSPTSIIPGGYKPQ